LTVAANEPNVCRKVTGHHSHRFSNLIPDLPYFLRGLNAELIAFMKRQRCLDLVEVDSRIAEELNFADALWLVLRYRARGMEKADCHYHQDEPLQVMRDERAKVRGRQLRIWTIGLARQSTDGW